MSRRSVLAGLPALPLRAQGWPPNLVVIVAGDHGWDEVGCYGHPGVRTPHLDRLAADGVRFTRCYCTSPLCSPGRGAVMAGLHPSASGVTRLVRGVEAESLSLRRGRWTFASGLQALGYRTVSAREWHLSTFGATAHGFDESLPSRDS